MRHGAGGATLLLVVGMALGLVAALVAPAQAADRRQPTTGAVSWTSDTWVSGAGTGYALHGTVNGPPRRPLLLQHATATGWRTLDRTRARRGAFSFADTWDWYGVHRVRVLAPATARHRARAFGHRVRVASGYEARGLADDHRLTRHRKRRMRMDPCRPVHYRVNPGRMGPEAEPLVHSAVGLFARATGIRFRHVGRSRRVAMTARRLERGTDLLIGWAGERRVPSLRGTVARGGPLRFVPGRDRHGPVWRITQAGVTINHDTTAPGPGQAVDLAMDSQSRATLGMTVLHELGHAFGLEHASTGRAGRLQLMYWSIDMAPWSDGWFRSLFGAGDLAGLRKVGLAAGCVR